MVKKLRYYARFIVVCLLLKKMKLVRDLVRVSSFVSENVTKDCLETTQILYLCWYILSFVKLVLNKGTANFSTMITYLYLRSGSK